ncbi:MAG: hypothetical protein H7841_14225 [Magnetospirillum sp. WYHS-4]
MESVTTGKVAAFLAKTVGVGSIGSSMAVPLSLGVGFIGAMIVFNKISEAAANRILSINQPRPAKRRR